MKIAKLLLRPTPFPDESFLGYFIRLTELNGYDSPNRILKHLGIPIILTRNKSRVQEAISQMSLEMLEKLADLIEKPIPQILKLISIGYFGQNSLTSMTGLSPKIIHCFPSKFCPLCLSESAHHRKIWDLIMVTTCPLHKCNLESFCPNCSKPLNLNRASVCVCICGLDFRNISPKLCTDDQTNLTEYIYSNLGLLTSNSQFIPENSLLINYSLKEVSEIIYYFLQKMVRLNYQQSLYVAKSLPQTDMHGLVCKAFKIFDNFPSNYLSHIEEIIKQKQSYSPRSSFKYFIDYHTNYTDGLPASLNELLYKVFNDSIGDILSKYQKAPSHVIYPTSITDIQLANHLQINVTQITKLATTNEIPAIEKYKSGKTVRYKFEGDVFFKIMSKIRKNKRTPINLKREKLINFIQISEYLSDNNIQIHQFLGSVLRGDIRACLENYDSQGLHRFVFKENDVKF